MHVYYLSCFLIRPLCLFTAHIFQPISLFVPAATWTCHVLHNQLKLCFLMKVFSLLKSEYIATWKQIFTLSAPMYPFFQQRTCLPATSLQWEQKGEELDESCHLFFPDPLNCFFYWNWDSNPQFVLNLFWLFFCKSLGRSNLALWELTIFHLQIT